MSEVWAVRKLWVRLLCIFFNVPGSTSMGCLRDLASGVCSLEGLGKTFGDNVSSAFPYLRSEDDRGFVEGGGGEAFSARVVGDRSEFAVSVCISGKDWQMGTSDCVLPARGRL